ncbi:MAG: hypothetical protein NTW03_16790, partial [Verrucomicrobia bacterium]|nr:hypothetical protein [Verrucomicrobiota bacterium]
LTLKIYSKIAAGGNQAAVLLDGSADALIRAPLPLSPTQNPKRKWLEIRRVGLSKQAFGAMFEG